MESEYLLSTYDNPYSPFDEYDQWLEYDEKEAKYCTNEYLAWMIALFVEHLSLDEDSATDLAVDEIVRVNPLGVHIKLSKTEADKLKIKRANANVA